MKEELIWPVCLVPPELLATASTIFRLIYRKHNQGLWWDDHFVLISLILAFICFVVPWLSLVQGHPTLHIVSGWLYKLSLPTQIWTGRISLALTVARIMPRQHPIFSLALCVVVFFGVVCLTMIISSIVPCVQDTAWALHSPYVYFPSRPLGIFAVAADFVGDVLLVVVPLRLFWHAKLRPVELFLVKIGFAASFFTSAFGIVIAVFIRTRASSK